MLLHAYRLTSLFSSVALLLAGHGLQLSLLPLRAQDIGWSSAEIGLTGSAYFAGFLVGCYQIPKLVRGVGHIRVFTVLTATMTGALLAISLTDALVMWILLRLVIGISVSGLYLVLESWLNEEAPDEQRGALLSVYTMIVLAAMAAGQAFLNVDVPGGAGTIIIAAMCVALAAIPIGLTRLPHPSQVPPAKMSPLLVLRTSRTAAMAAFVSGLVSGSFYSLGAVYGRQVGLEVGAVSLMIAAGILGGAFFQFPLGRLSDRVDRRFVMFAAMIGGMLVCLVAAVLPPAFLPYLFFFFGGSVMPLYALSLALASDHTESSFLEVGTGILLMNASGSIVGPLVAAAMMGAFAPVAFFIFCGVTLFLGATGLAVFILRRGAPAHGDPFSYATTASAQGAIELDPRSEDEQREAAINAADKT
jgi:MFS family permease